MLKMESSPERDNFVKLSYVLLDVVARHLREYFVKLWDQKYPNEKWNDDVVKRDLKLQSLLVTKSGKQRDDIYSQNILKGDEQKWDITTLIRALLDSGFKLIEGCRTPDERTIPLRESEEIEIIRGIRNTDYGHISSMSCPLDEFIDIMEKIKRVAKHLFGKEAKKEIHKIEMSPSTPNMREQVDKLLKGEFLVRNKYVFKITYSLFPLTFDSQRGWWLEPPRSYVEPCPLHWLLLHNQSSVWHHNGTVIPKVSADKDMAKELQRKKHMDIFLEILGKKFWAKFSV